MKQYYEILRELREDRDLTQAQIAKVLGTTQQVYSRYEKGENEMPVRHVITLCKFYGISADYVLGLKSEQNNGKRIHKNGALRGCKKTVPKNDGKS
ncbi:MAG: helix-turn-helix domain-containing protein [Clostridia bacterium]|nr:helix-turn-helix domain-containing protein [Clostridia bacterium]